MSKQLFYKTLLVAALFALGACATPVPPASLLGKWKFAGGGLTAQWEFFSSGIYKDLEPAGSAYGTYKFVSARKVRVDFSAQSGMDGEPFTFDIVSITPVQLTVTKGGYTVTFTKVNK